MYQLLYVSSATRKMSNPELGAILDAARRNNVGDGITGMLLHIDGNFLQVLEGEEEVVERTFARISSDSRHSGVVALLRREVASRTFHDWSMGFERISSTDSEQSEQIFRISDAAIRGRMSPDAPQELLMFLTNFRQINRSAMPAEA